jgi:nicotinate phosphoribosyltransferase
VHFQSLVAGKAARCVDAARGRLLVDFGLRRTHRADAGMRAARSSYLAGFDSTSNVLAGKEYGIPTAGTMAHSYVEAFDDELAAFRAFARAYPDRSILLVDTYDTEQGVRNAAIVAAELASSGHRLLGVRLDSGDLLELSRRARQILDEAGSDAIVFASGGLDERDVSELLAAGAPIDGFGIGTSLTTSSDVPALDCAYKLQEYAGLARRKRSVGKATWPGRKQVWRSYGADGRMAGDVLTVEGDRQPGEPLLQPVMQGGKRLAPSPSLAEIRQRVARELEQLPEPLRRMEPAATYPVEIADALVRLAAEVDARLALHERAQP